MMELLRGFGAAATTSMKNSGPVVGGTTPTLPVTPPGASSLLSSPSESIAGTGTSPGPFSHLYDSLLIVDARWPYEYAGGHIRGALNLYTPAMLFDHLAREAAAGAGGAATASATPTIGSSTGSTPPASSSSLSFSSLQAGQRRCLVFHCEFSQERGPNLYRRLRKRDREVHSLKGDWRGLDYPEMYILDGQSHPHIRTRTHACAWARIFSRTCIKRPGAHVL
jgi:hypothetical protein